MSNLNLRPRDRAVLGVLIALVIVAAFYMLVLKPEQQQASSLASQVSAQRAALASAQASYTTGRAAEAALEKQGADWAALQRAVPANSDIPALLRLLQRDAQAVGVHVKTITLTGSSSSASAPASSSSPSPASAGATSVPLQLTFGGGYIALNKLVKRLNSLVHVAGPHVRASGPLMSISNISVTSGSGSSGGSSTGSASATTVQLTANIYQLASATAGATGGQS